MIDAEAAEVRISKNRMNTFPTINYACLHPLMYLHFLDRPEPKSISSYIKCEAEPEKLLALMDSLHTIATSGLCLSYRAG
jgi:hypothetical protein